MSLVPSVIHLGKTLIPSNVQRSPLAQSASPAQPAPAMPVPAGSQVRFGPQLPVLHSGPISHDAPALALPIGTAHMPSLQPMPARQGMLTVHESPTLPPVTVGGVEMVPAPPSVPAPRPTPHERRHAKRKRPKRD